jgi:hypothetical protein
MELLELELFHPVSLERKTLSHEKEVIAVLLELGALIEMSAVLDSEGMEVEALSQQLERARFG